MSRIPLAHVPGVLSIPAWEHYLWLRAGFSTRQGGVSEVYGRAVQNLGWTEADLPSAVRANRERFVAAVSANEAMQLVTVRQVHGDVVHSIVSRGQLLETADGRAVLQGDGLVTDEPGILLGIQTADCVPVLVADTRQRVVAAYHAGWRGTLARIAEQGVGDMRRRFGTRPEDLVAAIGPCIGACCFAVGSEVRDAFESHFDYGSRLFSEAGAEMHLDLVEANRRQLTQAGVAEGNISTVDECTACARLATGERKYFSHRSEHGFTGRMMSVIGVATSSPSLKN